MKSYLIKVLGIDPSLNYIGLVKGTIDSALNFCPTEVLTLDNRVPNKVKLLEKRLPAYQKDMNRIKPIFNKLLPHVIESDLLIAESPSGSQSSRAMVSYAVCTTLLAYISTHTRLLTMGQKQLKSAVLGTEVAKGKVPKELMINWAKIKYPYLNWSKSNNLVEHQADAVGAVVAGLKEVHTKTIEEIYNDIIRD